MVARTAPAILELLGDGTPRPKSAIITALADRHPKEDVVRTLMRLAVTGQLVETERKYSLAAGRSRGRGRLTRRNGGRFHIGTHRPIFRTRASILLQLLLVPVAGDTSGSGSAEGARPTCRFQGGELA